MQGIKQGVLLYKNYCGQTQVQLLIALQVDVSVYSYI